MLRAVRTAPLYVLLVLALLFAAIAMIRGPIPPQATNLTTVVFLGDSITQGQHTDDFTQDYTWQTVLGLRAKSARNAQQYLFDGVGGATVGAFLGHLQALNLHPSNAQLIVVELGTNDYLNNVPPATVEQNYMTLLLYLAANNPVARLVALTVWGDPVAESAYNSAIAQAAAIWTGVGGRAIVDLGPLFLNPLNHWPTGDTFHPNDAGQAAIAQAVLAAVPNTGPSTP